MSIKKLVWFASSIVLLEFATYASNDMILPAMPSIVERFGGGVHHISLSMSLYILGCTCFQLFVAPLADYYGQRQMLRFGAVYFTVVTLLILLSEHIYSFLAFRFLAGASMAFSSLGYSFINQFYDDKQSTKIVALMQNFTIISPIAGPMIGIVIISYLSWHYVFLFTALLGLLSFFGISVSLKKIPRPLVKTSMRKTISMYGVLLRNSNYVLGALACLFMVLPSIIWIATSTTVIKTTLRLDNMAYVTLQLLALGGILFSAMLIHLLAGRVRFSSLMLVGILLATIGLLIGIFSNGNIYQVASGMLIFGFGSMTFNTLTIRILGTIPFENTNMIFTLLTFIRLLGFFVAIIISEYAFAIHDYEVATYSSIWMVLLVLIIMIGLLFIYKNRKRQWQTQSVSNN